MDTSIKDIDAYIAAREPDIKIRLEKLRHTIRTLVPGAEEIISYGMPAFKYHGMLVGFAAAKDHIGLYPWNSSTIEAFKDELKDFSTSKGTIRFPNDKPLPLKIVKMIVKARVKENLSKSKK